MTQYKTPHVIVFESALFRTISTLVVFEDALLLVDPTWLPHEINDIRNQIQLIKQERPLYLLFTHSDYDHIIAWKAFPDARVIVSKTFEENPAKQTILDQINKFDQEYYISRNYPIAYPKGDIIIEEDGQQIAIGNNVLTFYLAPGHNVDGVFTVVENSQIFIAGDYLSNIEFPYVYNSVKNYYATLEKSQQIIAQYDIRLLIPGHGDVATNKKEMLKRIKESYQYLDQLIAAIKGGQPFDEDFLWQRYQFPGGMRNFHEGNIRLIKKEFDV